MLKELKKGEMITVKILDIDTEKERVVLGVKQIVSDEFQESVKGLQKGQIITVSITEITPDELHVKSSEGIPGAIRKNELARDRDDRRISRFAVGEKLMDSLQTLIGKP